MKLFSSAQVKDIDVYTIEHEPISSIDLMERAAEALFAAIVDLYPHGYRFVVFCGPGNNGGDGLAVARLLALQGKATSVFLINDVEKLSPDAFLNYKRLEKIGNVSIQVMHSEMDFPDIFSGDIVIDALFGSGLSRPLTGFPNDTVRYLNESCAEVISIDIPSGLPGEDSFMYPAEGIVRATRTLTLQFPKLSFFFPENELFVGEFLVLSIGLHPSALVATPTPYSYITATDVVPLVPSRPIFGHKGTFGHLLLIAGSKGMMGASVLASRAAYRAGAGLVTTHVPAGQGQIIQVSIPEAVVSEDIDTCCFSCIDNLNTFSAVVVGPGISTQPKAKAALRQLFIDIRVPLLLDADAINIIAEERDLLEMLPADTILTPHPKELSRLVGSWTSSFNRLKLQQEFAQKYKVILLCKGAYTTIALPNGELLFISTGNPGMATGGSGDVLAGLIGSLLAQGLLSEKAATLGVYLHGLAGDMAEKVMGQQAIIASDLVDFFGKAWLDLLESHPSRR